MTHETERQRASEHSSLNLAGLLGHLRPTAPTVTLAGLRAGQPVPDQHLLRAARPFVVASLVQDMQRPILISPGALTARTTGRAASGSGHPTCPSCATPNPRRSSTSAHPGQRAPSKPACRRWPRSQAHRAARGDEPPPPIVITSAHALLQKTLLLREFHAGTRVLRVGAHSQPEALLRTGSSSATRPPTLWSSRERSAAGEDHRHLPYVGSAPCASSFRRRNREPAHLQPANSTLSAEHRPGDDHPRPRSLARYAPRVAEQLATWFAAQPEADTDAASSRPDQELWPMASPSRTGVLHPYLYSHPASLFDYVPDNALVIVDDQRARGQRQRAGRAGHCHAL